LSGRITWYSAPDNDPPGSRAIAYPGSPPRHQQAGGTGTYQDPQTFATEDTSVFPPGTRIYVPKLQRYYIMEDFCGCNFSGNHVDLWLEPSGTNQQVAQCENALPNGSSETIIKNPDPNRPVDLRPLMSNGVCRVP
jgi:3D (Asp-Asp-Asp) domain-containing protein